MRVGGFRRFVTMYGLIRGTFTSFEINPPGS